MNIPKLLFPTLFFIFFACALVYGQNTPPEFINAPNEINLMQNTPEFLNVWDIVQDNETSDDLLDYQFAVSEPSIELFYDDFSGELTITPIDDYFGNADLDITVTDPEFEEAFIIITLNVEAINTPPEFVNAPTEINLTQNTPDFLYVWDIVEDAQTSDDLLDYQFTSSTPDIELNYDNSVGELTISPINDFFGTEFLDITVSDPQLEEAFTTITLNVEAVNTPPEFVNAPSEINLIQNTPEFLYVWDIVEDAQTSDDLLDYQFSASTPFIELIYNDLIGELTITPIDNYFGVADLDITVTDPEFEAAFITITLNVEQLNTPPEFVNAPTEIDLIQNTPEFLNVWNIVQDAETSDDLLDYQFSASTPSIELFYDNLFGELTITPIDDFLGNADLIITVSDPQLEEAIANITLNVEVFNSPPEFVNVPAEIVFDQNTQYIFNVWDIVQDAETSDDLLDYQFASGTPSVELNYDNVIGELTITPINDYFGTTTLDITVNDPQFEEAFTAITVTVEEVNTPPEFVGLPAILFLQSNSSYFINIWPYVVDVQTPDEDLDFVFLVNQALITLSYSSGTGELQINPNGYFGDALLQIVVEDEGGLSISSNIDLDIEYINTPPEFVNAPAELNLAQNTDYLFNVWEIVQDVETSDDLLDYEFFSSTPDIELTYNDLTGILTISPINNFFGIEGLDIIVTDPEAEQAFAAITLIVDEVNTPPEFINPPAEIYLTYNTEYLFNVWDIVADAETSDDLLDYQFFSSTEDIELTFDNLSGVLTISPAFLGVEGLDIIVSDPQLSEAYVNIALVVENTAPQFVNAPTEINLMSNTEYLFNVWDIVQDAETNDNALDYVFFVSSELIELAYDAPSGILSIVPTNNYLGTEGLEITVTDPQSEESFISILLNVENTPPQFVNLPDTLHLQSDMPYELNLWPFVEDNETDDADLIFVFSINQDSVVLSYDNLSGDLQIDPAGYFGLAILQVEVEDANGLSISSPVVLDVEQANTAPQFVNLPDTLYLQSDSPFFVNLWPFVEDAESPDTDLNYIFSINQDTIVLSFDSISGTLEINPNGYSGSALLQIEIEDQNGLSISASIVLNIELGNTPPQFVDLPDTLYLQSDSPYVLNLWPYVEDAETADAELSFVFSIDEVTIAFSFDNISGDLEINPNGFFGVVSFNLTVIDALGDSISAEIVIAIEQIVSSLGDDHIVRRADLDQNYPNPFNPSTHISYQISENSDVTLKVFDITGREKATLVNSRQTAGKYTVFFDASMLPSGIYFYRLATTEGFIQTRRMMLVK